MHTFSEMILWCSFDRKTSSPRKFLWGPMWNTHNKTSCSNTGCWDWAGNQKQQLGWEITSCQEKLAFDLTPGSKSQELSWKVPLSVVAWPGHYSPVLWVPLSLESETLRPQMWIPWPCQAPIQDLFLWLPHQAHSLLLTLVAVFLSLRPQEPLVPQTPDVRPAHQVVTTVTRSWPSAWYSGSEIIEKLKITAAEHGS